MSSLRQGIVALFVANITTPKTPGKNGLQAGLLAPYGYRSLHPFPHSHTGPAVGPHAVVVRPRCGGRHVCVTACGSTHRASGPSSLAPSPIASRFLTPAPQI